ncbi:transposase [Bifidobacteriaceae bacterium MCC01972]|nr:transposase [Bifidobacteriaceae bacterium MCC01972]GDZ00443.1 transposase [Bifidobacteriaceae bacterium MCC01975]
MLYWYSVVLIRNEVIAVKLESNHHSVFLMHYHLVLVVKYRRKVFDDEMSNRAREIFEYIAPKYGIALEEWNHDMDHVHVLFRAQPKSELSKFINAYKSASSRLLKQEYPQIRQKLWKEYFWSRSFCLLTTGGAPVEVIRKYIENQGEKSRTQA